MVTFRKFLYDNNQRADRCWIQASFSHTHFLLHSLEWLPSNLLIPKKLLSPKSVMIIQEIVKSKHFYKVHVMLCNLSILQILSYLILITTLWCVLLLLLFLCKWGNWGPGRLNDLTNVTQLVSSRGKKNSSDSLQPHGLQPSRLLHPWDSSGKNTGVGCHALLQGIFPTQVSCIAGKFFTPELPGKPSKWHSQDSNAESGSKVIAVGPLHSELDLFISTLSVWNTITPLLVGPSLLDLS